MHISLTRLRLRSLRFLPAFMVYALRSESQVRSASGFHKGSLLPDRKFTFWTMTMWDSAESMRAYMTSGAHKAAMPKLLHWCDQASVTHWQQDGDSLPSWEEAEFRMRTEGRPSKVLHPASGHTDLTFESPRLRPFKTIAKR
ncbi:DUF3291 domain-containing protein [Terriglobus sp. ADX1]|uniref:DUF3291 domain-containing protein n=1 Tax=Terriglobus sp. ADX1 TaxID=2794063 RepID=UPI002FE5FA70